jgi:hypothetical protein
MPEVGDRHLHGDGGPLALERTCQADCGRRPAAARVGGLQTRPRSSEDIVPNRLIGIEAAPGSNGCTCASASMNPTPSRPEAWARSRARLKRRPELSMPSSSVEGHAPLSLDRCAARSAADVEHPLTGSSSAASSMASPNRPLVPSQRSACGPELLGLLRDQGRRCSVTAMDVSDGWRSPFISGCDCRECHGEGRPGASGDHPISRGAAQARRLCLRRTLALILDEAVLEREQRRPDAGRDPILS